MKQVKEAVVRKTSFLHNLRRTFLLLIFVPVLLLGGWIFFSSFSYIKAQTENSMTNLIKQYEVDLTNHLKQCDTSVLYTASNYSLQEYLQADPSRYQDVLNKFQGVSPLLSNVMLSNPYCKKLRIYALQEGLPETDFIKRASSVADQNWYKAVLETDDAYWGQYSGKLILARKIVTAYPKKLVGIIYMELKPEVLTSSFDLFDNMPLRVEVIGEDETVISQNREPRDSYHEIARTELAKTGLSVRYETNGKNFIYDVKDLVIPMLVVVLVLVVSWILFSVMSVKLLKDMNRLVEEVSEIKTGNLDVDIQESRVIEIDSLASTIREMTTRIKKLIQQVYTQEKERQSLELDLLKAKINPHFLYNNLSTINWLAIDCDEPQISEITSELANFYRTALNKDKDIDILQVEISNIQSYIRLQEIAHEDSFHVEFDVPDKLMKRMVPGFILQPLVENAIEHGIDLLRDTQGCLKISAEERESALVLKVHDNGMELYRKIGASELPRDDFGYGTTNVHKRVQLLTTKDSGLRIYADETGTTSEIILYSRDIS